MPLPSFDPATTWIGMLGGGVSGAILAGGSLLQFDLHKMNGDQWPARVLIKGTRIGPIAYTGTSTAMCIVKECATAKAMDGLTDTGLDWELGAGLSAKGILKAGATLFKTVAKSAAEGISGWARNETAKRLVNWSLNDLSIVEPGKAFHVIPYPLQFGIGGGFFYEWQTMSLLGGSIAWKYLKPTWFIETAEGCVYFYLQNIPEQNGETIKIGFYIDEWGGDPAIRWKRHDNAGGARVEKPAEYHIKGVVYDGILYENHDSYYSGINLSHLTPIGRLESDCTTNDTVEKSTSYDVYPVVFRGGNMTYWEADEAVTVDVNKYGRWSKHHGHEGARS
jgi:hypothetical protein